MMNLRIRNSKTTDLPAIEALYPAAFPDEDLLPLVRSLLPDAAVATSYVAEIEEEIVGNIIFTDCRTSDNNDTVALLAPLAVAPKWQGQGIGSALVRHGLQELQDRDVHTVCVLGDPAYYGRFGFREESALSPPYPLPKEFEGAWQSQRLNDFTAELSGELQVPTQWRMRSLWVE